MKTIKTLALLLVVAFAMTACSSSDDGESITPSPQETTTKQLIIKIAGTPGSRATGAAPSEATEATIKNLVVAIYDNTNKKIDRVRTYDNPTVSDDGSGNKYIQETIAYSTTQPSVLVLANVPDSLIKNTSTEADIKNAVVSLAVTQSGGTQLSSSLPMVGSSANLTPDANETQRQGIDVYTTSVVLNRLVARVGLVSITSQLTNGAEFHVTDVFLRHAYSTSTLNFTDDQSRTGYFTFAGNPTVDKLVEGINDDASKSIDKEDVASYLSNSYTAGSTVWNINSGDQAYFYTFPNPNTTFSTQTQLVIKGQYKESSTAQEETVYYPIVINGTDYDYTDKTSESATGTIKANRIYNISATIVGKGQEPGGYIPGDPINATGRVVINITVAPWAATITQNATVGN